MKEKPWRTVLPVKETGRFTHQQLEDAVNAVIEMRRVHDLGRPLMVRERGPEWGKPVPPPPPATPAEPVPYEFARRGRRNRRRRSIEAGE
jgi:hypothetical protein